MASKLDRLKNKGFKNTENPLESIVRGDREPGGEYMELNIDDIETNPDNDIYREADTEEEDFGAEEEQEGSASLDGDVGPKAGGSSAAGETPRLEPQKSKPNIVKVKSVIAEMEKGR